MNAKNIQVGNNNIQNIDYSAQDFVNSLANFKEKSSEEKKSIITELSKLVKNGANLGNVISKFAEILS